MPARGFSEVDLRQLAERGIPAAEAEAQLARLQRTEHFVRLVRPCTVGDGIERIPPESWTALEAAHAEAARPGRLLKLVPASGAATRMFADLHAFHEGPGQDRAWSEILREAGDGSRRARTLVELLGRIHDFAFHDELERVVRRRGAALDDLAARGRFAPVLDALLGAQGLGYDSLPKGLVHFHRYEHGARTAFEEHLVEATHYARDASGLCRLHLTVSRESRDRFEQVQHEAESRLGPELGVRFEVGYSLQKPSTDTIAIDAEGRLLRDDAGAVRVRPAGHGALIENLNELRADLVFIKNIDNVQPDRAKPLVAHWKRLLAGRLVQLQQAVFARLEQLRTAEAPHVALDSAAEFVGRVLGARPSATAPAPTHEGRSALLIDRLDRPLRVCGVVPNTGEPGGGPFWVAGAEGSETVQIVESAQVDPGDGGQQAIWRSSTHFNPVDLVCGLRDAAGKAFELSRYVDAEAAIVTSKTEAGFKVRVLERPGLWNGAMAGWNTVFVEVPIETFTPVKTLCDLLRDEHRA